MLTICGWGGPDPRPSALDFPQLSGEDEVPLHKSSGRLAARDGTFKKVLVLGRGTSRCSSSSQRQDGGVGMDGKGSRASGEAAWLRGCGAEGDPGAAVGRADPRLQSKGTPAVRGNLASDPKIGRAPHLDSGP